LAFSESTTTEEAMSGLNIEIGGTPRGNCLVKTAGIGLAQPELSSEKPLNGFIDRDDGVEEALAVALELPVGEKLVSLDDLLSVEVLTKLPRNTSARSSRAPSSGLAARHHPSVSSGATDAAKVLPTCAPRARQCCASSARAVFKRFATCSRSTVITDPFDLRHRFDGRS
jgi:hypothetical protein